MVEVTGAAAVVGAAILVGKQVLGPTIQQFGKDLEAVYSAWRAENFKRILERAARRKPSGDSGVHPRVAHEVLDAGSWVNDDVQQEYLAGLLNSARSPDGQDDGMAYLARIAANMTALQTRVHNAIYSALPRSVEPEGGEWPRPFAFHATLGFTVTTDLADFEAAVGNHGVKIVDAFNALNRDGLLVDFGHGLAIQGGPVNMKYVWAMPTALGARLYLTARGSGMRPADDILQLSREQLDTFDPEPPRLQRAKVGRSPERAQ
ncbi:hypothetical protein [Occultella kanbiaonis]|uniref:hypothetical protein n=1 Tax=Occultella kanbiaonis TaxID=2675754 RepID=UPI0012B765E4|nr:hypothetical protein [Occultella kanbiaonis]